MPRVAVIGLGLIGGSVALAARERLGAHVTGWDSDPKVLAAAPGLGVVDEVASGIDRLGAGGSLDVVIAATPVGALADAIGAAIASCPEAVVSDVGSTKQRLCEAGFGPRYIGGHPMAGAEVAGIEHARADLFAGSAWYLTPRTDADGVLLERLHRFVSGVGAKPVVIDPAEHDRLMAAFSHLPHLIANLLVERGRSALGGAERAVLGPSFRDATRVAGANPELWGGIYSENSRALVGELDAVIAALGQARSLVQARDEQALVAAQKRAAEDRETLTELAGRGGPSEELRVIVPNRPGVVAELALALAEAGISIQDLSLQPAPDNRSGEVGLWVAAERADEARRLIEQAVGGPGQESP